MLIAMLCDFCVADDSVEYEALYYGLCSVFMADVEAGLLPREALVLLSEREALWTLNDETS